MCGRCHHDCKYNQGLSSRHMDTFPNSTTTKGLPRHALDVQEAETVNSTDLSEGEMLHSDIHFLHLKITGRFFPCFKGEKCRVIYVEKERLH